MRSFLVSAFVLLVLALLFEWIVYALDYSESWGELVPAFLGGGPRVPLPPFPQNLDGIRPISATGGSFGGPGVSSRPPAGAGRF